MIERAVRREQAAPFFVALSHHGADSGKRHTNDTLTIYNNMITWIPTLVKSWLFDR